MYVHQLLLPEGRQGSHSWLVGVALFVQLNACANYEPYTGPVVEVYEPTEEQLKQTIQAVNVLEDLIGCDLISSVEAIPYTEDLPTDQKKDVIQMWWVEDDVIAEHTGSRFYNGYAWTRTSGTSQILIRELAPYLLHTIAHELGHALGASHVDTEENLMHSGGGGSLKILPETLRHLRSQPSCYL